MSQPSDPSPRRGAPRLEIEPAPALHGAAELEDRVVAALRRRRLLGAPRRTRRSRRAVLVAAGASGLALFASGVAAGQWLAGRQTAAVVSAALAEPLAQAMRVQEAGSAYVRAVAELTELAEAGEVEALAPGREAAGVALYAAALELARLSPEDATLQRVLDALEMRARRASPPPPLPGGASLP